MSYSSSNCQENSQRPGKNLLTTGILLGGAALLVGAVIRQRRDIAEKSLLEAVKTAAKCADGLTAPPEPGDILLFYRPNRSRDYLIKWITHSRFYHAAVYAGSDQVIEARPKGVLCNNLKGRENEYIVLPAPDHKGAEALAWAEKQIGDPFDKADMLVIALEHLLVNLRLNYSRPGRYTCGELVASAYQYGAHLRLFPEKKPGEVAPSDFTKFLPGTNKKAKENAA